MTITEADEISDEERHENQLRLLKGQVKAIMEEAVTKKFVHEESAHVLRLCGTVEACLLDGLKKRTAGFFRYNKIANLYTKVGKSLPDVSDLVSQIEDTESSLDKSSSQTGGYDSRSLHSFTSNSNTNGGSSRKYLWVRIALTSKLLARIIEYLVENHVKFYESSSIMSDPVRGKILASLVVGPCALDYTKMKTHDHYWSDPPADELLQRHKLHSRRGNPSSPGKRPALNFASMRHHSSSDSLERNSSFRDYVESLHQNSKMTLLYGKNNVVVQPQEEVGPIPGYLSLHQEASCIMIKWTPNQLMNVPDGNQKPTSSNMNGSVHSNGNVATGKGKDQNQAEDTRLRMSSRNSVLRRRSNVKRSMSAYWDYAISVDIRDIVYLHCHQQLDKGGTLVLVGQDGVQWPPIRFPPGGHMLSFLSCLETGLLPHGCLDPPLWSQKGKGKMFPKLRRKSRRSDSNSELEEPTDFVFRVTVTSDSSNYTSWLDSATKTEPRYPQFDLMQSIFTLPALWGKSFSHSGPRRAVAPAQTPSAKPRSNSIARSVVIRRESNPHRYVAYTGHYVQPANGMGKGARPEPVARDRLTKCEREPDQDTTGTWDSSDGFVPHLDMYTWDQNKPRHYDLPNDPNLPSNTDSYSGSSLKTLCDTMRRQIISRAFYGWLAHCRHLTSVRTHLSGLVNDDVILSDSPTDATCGIDDVIWGELVKDGKLTSLDELMRHVYYGGVKSSQHRPIVWSYMLGHYPPGSSEAERHVIDEDTQATYENIMSEWLAVEEAVKLRDQEMLGNNSKVSVSSASSSSCDMPRRVLTQQSSNLSDVFTSSTNENPDKNVNDKFEIIDEAIKSAPAKNTSQERNFKSRGLRNRKPPSEDSHVPYSSVSSMTSLDCNSSFSLKSFSLDDVEGLPELEALPEESDVTSSSDNVNATDDVKNVVPASSVCNGTATSTEATTAPYSVDLLEQFGLNLHRIEKDVQRCDRNHSYFAQDGNLHKLRNVMCCYVWRHLDVGYMQGMCDIAAPLLVVLDDESLVYRCFVFLMRRMGNNFPNGGAMDTHFSNMRSLIQILDAELFEHMHKNGDYTHFYFCYRWFLLDFKRELSYDEDVFSVWECIWAARHCSSEHFVLFFALAMLENYRDIILENDMDFTDIIKFFNEMAEKHSAMKILTSAKNLVAEVQQLIHK